MRGGLERWKRGVGSHGVRQALGYAFQGSCDSHLRSVPDGVDAVAVYGDAARSVTRFIIEDGAIRTDTLDEVGLRRWVDGCDPETGERRGRDLSKPEADLILDGTINFPKSFSVAALINADLAREFEDLQDRLRDRVIATWQRELNARRGAGGRIRESLSQVEVVELRHRRSRALDPHIHRHLWLNVKVQGEDGNWSNVDSRVAMKLHTVINAEGELTARTDPQWMSALARHGYTIDADGEVAELAHTVRPLSRRSNQIEANRAMLLAAWRAEHPGQQPSPDELHRIDRLAWAKGRPNKPGDLDEAAWEELIAEELAAVDPTIRNRRAPVPLHPRPLWDLDFGLLAAQAIVEADARSAGCGGRFSLLDVRAGAIRAVAASGVVSERVLLQPVIEEIVSRAVDLTVNLLDGEIEVPAHVKARMASTTAALKVELAARFDALARAGAAVSADTVAAATAGIIREGLDLDAAQLKAAASIAGTDVLVSVTGPAGAGKTSMLRVANAVVEAQGRRMVVVAPTKKAASVAGREIGTAASSLHGLLADHGFRWGRDEAGTETWMRLSRGDVDPSTGYLYPGPRRYPLIAGDRIVVDEAGMVDLHTANALATIAAQTGAGIAMVGDHLQARPVGHSGAMASMTRRATAVIELSAVHRFTHPEYAALTLRMREPASKDAALSVAADLHERGLIHRVADHVEARQVMVDEWFRWAGRGKRIALVTSTNEEADTINDAIQQHRIDNGQLSQVRIAVGQDEQRLLEGDIVQTRRNDRASDVENRALWLVRCIRTGGLELQSLGDSGDTRTVTHEYAAEHVHLAYASTIHGIQGETTDASIVGPGVDAAGLYVGMTRGRAHNEAIAIARGDNGARDQVADSMLRGTTEVTLDDSTRAATAELHRAARTPARPDEAPAPWTDRDRRPFGHVVDVEHLVDLTRRDQHHSRDALENMNDLLRATKRSLLALDSQIASQTASQHGRDGEPEATNRLDATRRELRTRYESQSQDYQELTASFIEQAQLIEDLTTERNLRLNLDDSLRQVEQRDRTERATVAASPELALPGVVTRLR